MKNLAESTTEIKYNFTIPVAVERAFEVFAQEMNSWWPKEYTWAGEVLEVIAIEPAQNGRCFERGPHGFECDWGRVLVWEPPSRLRFTWQISPDRVPEPNPDNASEIEVNFSSDEDNETQVIFHHYHFEHHGEGAEKYKEALESPQGWPYILSCYKEVFR